MFGGLGFWSGRRWVWPAVLLLVLDLLALWGRHDELADPFVGPAIAAEAGRGYVVQTYLFSALAIAATTAGIIFGMIEWRKRRRGKTKESAAPARVPVN